MTDKKSHARMRANKKAKIVDLGKLRARLGLSQAGFARMYGISLNSIRNWEQGRSRPRRGAIVLFELISQDPTWIAALIRANP